MHLLDDANCVGVGKRAIYGENQHLQQSAWRLWRGSNRNWGKSQLKRISFIAISRAMGDISFVTLCKRSQFQVWWKSVRCVKGNVNCWKSWVFFYQKLVDQKNNQSKWTKIQLANGEEKILDMLFIFCVCLLEIALNIIRFLLYIYYEQSFVL